MLALVIFIQLVEKERFTVVGDEAPHAIRIRPDDLTLRTLSTYFHLVPNTIVLTPDKIGGFSTWRMDRKVE